MSNLTDWELGNQLMHCVGDELGVIAYHLKDNNYKNMSEVCRNLQGLIGCMSNMLMQSDGIAMSVESPSLEADLLMFQAQMLKILKHKQF